MERGQIQNLSFLDYRAPLATESPSLITGIVETRNSGGDELISGMVAAIANAVYNATGVRVKTLPILPEKILQGLKRKR